MTRTLLKLELPIKVVLVSLPLTCGLLHLTDLRVQTMGLAPEVASVEITRPASIIPTLTLLEQTVLVAVTVALATTTTPPLDVLAEALQVTTIPLEALAVLAAVMAALAMMTIPPPDALAEALQVTTIPLEALAVLAPAQITTTTRVVT